jgi:type IV pilus assembly protein PilE
MDNMTRRTALGLTLVELMVTLAVLAILVTIGYPMYVTQVQKSRRVDARAGVMEMVAAQEREFAAWGGYSEPSIVINNVTANDGAPAPDAASVFNSEIARISGEYSDYYNFTINATDTTFTITAATRGNQAGDTGCASFSVDQTGTKNATDVNLCW